MPASITLARAVTLALALGPGAAWATQFDYSLYTGIEHSNNITLSNSNPVSQNVLIPGLNFTYVQLGSVFQANIAGTLEYRDYLGNQFGNETQGQLAAQTNWTVMPGRLDFAAEDYAGIQPVNSLASNSPANQQQTNVVLLGPTLHVDIGEALRGQVDLRYINSYASKVTDFNSSRGLAAFRVFRDLSPTDQLSANAEIQRVDFTNSSNGSGNITVVGNNGNVIDTNGSGPNYDRDDAFVRYTSKLAKFDLDVSLGWSQLSFDHLPSESKPLVRLTLGWEPTLRSSFSLAGVYQYADAAQDITQPPGRIEISDTGVVTGPANTGLIPGPGNVFNTGSGISIGNLVIDSQVYLERTLEASYSFHSERVTLSVAPLYDKLTYPNDPTFNQTGRGGSASLDYRLKPNLSVAGFVSGDSLKYATLDRRDRTVRFGAVLNHQLSLHWSWNASISRQIRNSDAVGQSYNENEVYVGVVYRR